MTLLAGKPDKWDAADATVEERRAILEATLRQPPDFVGRRPFRIKDWSTKRYMGPPPPVKWLVSEVMPLGTVGVLAAAGGTGKGFLLLDLALKVAQPPKPANVIDVMPDLAFGCRVMEHGEAVILAAEDSEDELHRRLASLDPNRRLRDRADERLNLIPLPNAGGARPLFVEKNGETVPTDFYAELCDQLRAIPDLKLLVIDPLQSFVHADINADPHVGGFVFGQLGALATETGATIVVAHHMGKTARPIESPEQARAAIRGTTGIVDSGRWSYAIWPMPEDKAKRTFRTLGAAPRRNALFEGAMVKANGVQDSTVRSYLRNEKTGLLCDMTSSIRAKALPSDELADLLVAEIARAARDMKPFTKSGEKGLFKRRAEMGGRFHNISKERFAAMVEQLIGEQRIVRCDPKGWAGALDVPDGQYALGHEAQVERKARPKRETEDEE